MPPITNPPQLLLGVTDLFSKNSSIVQDAMATHVLLSLCIPDTNDLSILKTKFFEAERDGFLSFIYPVNNSVSGIKLPFWVQLSSQCLASVLSEDGPTGCTATPSMAETLEKPSVMPDDDLSMEL
jgi:hypothetical protein